MWKVISNSSWENLSFEGTFSSEEEANKAIESYYANGGGHDDHYAMLIAIKV